MMKKGFAILSFLLATLTASHGRSSPSDWNWSLHELLRESTLVVTGKVSYDFMAAAPAFDLLRAEDLSILSGTETQLKQLRILCLPKTYGKPLGPMALPQQYYLFFLAPLSDEQWALVQAINPDADRQQMFQIIGNWKGAICLSAEFADLSNSAIRRQYGITDPEIILESVRQALTFLDDRTAPANSNTLTDAFLQDFNAAPFSSSPADPTRFHIREYTH